MTIIAYVKKLETNLQAGVHHIIAWVEGGEVKVAAATAEEANQIKAQAKADALAAKQKMSDLQSAYETALEKFQALEKALPPAPPAA